MVEQAALTLAQTLQDVQDWRHGPHVYRLAAGVAEGIDTALQELALEERQGEEEPLLMVLLLGGSGTGKSTLFNAFAGERLAPATIQRPTTTVPIAYVHAALADHHLTAYPPLQRLQVVRHQRDGLRQKILIDTPDFDTHQAMLEHRQAVLDLLPLCDLVLFVVSPEKYVDQATWEILLPQVPKHAFAFVFTKMDTLYDDGGVSPDRELRSLIQELGYEQPRLYRVAAEPWLQFRLGERQETPPQDDFLALEHWLEDELQRDDVAQLKASLLRRKLERLRQALILARPPAIDRLIPDLRQTWEQSLVEAATAFEAAMQAPVRLALRRLQMEAVIAQHQQFRGLLGMSFSLLDLMRYGPSLLLQMLRQEPSGAAYVQEHLRDVWEGATARETWKHLHLSLRHSTATLTIDTAGTKPLRWLDEHLAPLEREGPAWLSQSVPDLLADLMSPGMADNGFLRGVQSVFKGVFELLPWLFVLFLGYQLTVRFWQGMYLGVAYLLHAAAVLGFFCLLLHLGVALVFPLSWPRRHRRFTRVLSAQILQRLSNRYLSLLETLLQAVQQEQQHIEVLCVRLQALQQTGAVPERYGLQGVFATP